MILITGASGTVGRAVLDETRKSGLPCKALYRSEEDARKVPAGVSSVIGDFSSRASLKGPLQGIATVFLVCSPIPELVELESNVIDACVENGVSHVVLNSALGAADFPKSFPSWHRKVEDKLIATRLGYTILRPNGFLQNISAYLAPSIRAQGTFYAAMGNARTSLLDVRDIAAATTNIMSNPSAHAGKTYELNGPEAVSYPEIAQRISRVANREVKYVDIPEATQRKSLLGLGMPEWQVNALLELQEYYVSGKASNVTDVLQRIIGRAPIRLDQFLAEIRDDFRPQSANA
jgi:uncharacterized protein YbjT (DUF2867 family)